MGLDINAARFLLAEKTRGLHFGKLLTLGHQGLHMDMEAYEGFMKQMGLTASPSEYADDFFVGLGAEDVKSMDVSPYENADVIHDINLPLDNSRHSIFDTLIDGGTLEHVFNFPTAISNCMRLVKPGGHLILLTPWHNFAGHGFYQFSPELFYNTLSPANGYEIERMLIVAEGSWFSVRNPSEVKGRVEIRTKDEIVLHITARRLADSPIFESWPQQSDYSEAWKRGNYGEQAAPPIESFKSKMTRHSELLRNMQRKWRIRKYARALAPSRNTGLVRICASDSLPLSL